MLHARRFFYALPLALACFGTALAGCAGSDSDDAEGNDQFADSAMQAPLPLPPSSMLHGTWTGDGQVGRFASLTLLSDNRYHGTRTVICFKAPCDPIVQDGSYTIYGRDLHNLIVFDKGTPEEERYEYSLRDNDLYLRRLLEGAEWVALRPAGVAWCETSRECDLQHLPVGFCAGEYACESNACSWKCANGGDASFVGPKGTTNAQ